MRALRNGADPQKNPKERECHCRHRSKKKLSSGVMKDTVVAKDRRKMIAIMSFERKCKIKKPKEKKKSYENVKRWLIF